MRNLLLSLLMTTGFVAQTNAVPVTLEQIFEIGKAQSSSGVSRLPRGLQGIFTATYDTENFHAFRGSSFRNNSNLGMTLQLGDMTWTQDNFIVDMYQDRMEFIGGQPGGPTFEGPIINDLPLAFVFFRVGSPHFNFDLENIPVTTEDLTVKGGRPSSLRLSGLFRGVDGDKRRSSIVYNPAFERGAFQAPTIKGYNSFDVPEPGSLALLGLGLIGLLGFRKRRQLT